MIAGLKPYPEYRDENISWAHRLPAHWDIKRGKALFAESLLPVREEDEIVTCFRDGQVTLRKNRRTTGFMFALYEAGYQGVRKGQLVIHAMDAFAGAIGVSDSDGKCTPEYIVTNPRSDGINPQYYALLLRYIAHQGFIVISCPAVRERAPRFRYPNFGDMPLMVPPPEEQAVIVRFLEHVNGRLERAIRAKRKVIALLNEQKQAIIHRAVTCGLNPDVPLKPSGIPWLGPIPAHWKIQPLGRVLSERKENNDPIKTKNILSLSLHDGVVPYAERTRPGGNKAKEDLSAYKLAYPGDIVVNSMNVVVGSVGLSRYFGAVSPVYYMLRPREAGDIVEYFDAIFHDVAFQRSLFGLGNGIMVIQSKSSGKLNTIRMRIPIGKLNRVEIPYPPSSEQKTIVSAIAEKTEPVNTAINRLEREIALLREYRTRLVADVVTGQLDVRPAAPHLPAEVLSSTTLDSPLVAEASDEVEEVE